MRRLLSGSVIVLVVVALTGCGGGEPLYSVEGKVTMNGRPIPFGSVVFWKSAKETGDLTIEGVISKDGVYKIMTGGKTGAPLGEYTVTVDLTASTETTEPNPEAQPNTKTPIGMINPRYSNPSTSPLKVKVVPEPTKGAYDLKLVR